MSVFGSWKPPQKLIEQSSLRSKRCFGPLLTGFQRRQPLGKLICAWCRSSVSAVK